MTEIIAVRDVENHKIYILPTADDKPVKFVLEKDAKDFVDDGTVYTVPSSTKSFASFSKTNFTGLSSAVGRM